MRGVTGVGAKLCVSFRVGSPICNLLGAAIKSVNTWVVIGDKLDNQIFGLSQLEPWKIKIHQLLSLKCSRNLFSFTTYATACAYGL